MDEIRAQDPSFEVKGSISREQVDRIVRALPKATRIQALENTEKYINQNYPQSGWSDREKRHIARETIGEFLILKLLIIQIFRNWSHFLFTWKTT